MRSFSTKCFFSLVLFSICISATSYANLYLYSGKDTFYVSVRNDYFKDISMATGHVYVSGNIARIDVQAQGYRRGFTSVLMNPNVHYYSTDVRLSDPFTRAEILDEKGNYVENSHTDTFSQSLYWGDEYGIRGSIPKKGFEKLTTRDVGVRVDYMHAFAPRVYMSGTTDRWYLEVVIRRRDMSENFTNIQILAPRDPASGSTVPAVEPDVMNLVADYVKNQNLAKSLESSADKQVVINRLESLARDIRANFGALTENDRNQIFEKLPSSSPLGRELLSISKFNSLYNK